jgi:hypothetical protein
VLRKAGRRGSKTGASVLREGVVTARNSTPRPEYSLISEVISMTKPGTR